jgi:hypothetical protein
MGHLTLFNLIISQFYTTKTCLTIFFYDTDPLRKLKEY